MARQASPTVEPLGDLRGNGHAWRIAVAAGHSNPNHLKLISEDIASSTRCNVAEVLFSRGRLASSAKGIHFVLRQIFEWQP